MPLTAGIFLIIFNLQFIFREFDNNRLTSWEWAFAGVDMFLFVCIFSASLFAAYLFSRICCIEEKPVRHLFLFAFAGSMFFWSVPEVLVDTARYFGYAKHIRLYGPWDFLSQWGTGIKPWTDLPFIPFVYGLLFRYAGELRVVIQVFNSAMFALTVVLTYKIGLELWDRDHGYYAGLMLLGIPYLYSQVPLMMVDVSVMFLLTLSIYTFIKAVKQGGVWIFFAALAVFCAVYSKYSAWLMLSALGIALLIYLVVPPEYEYYLDGGARGLEGAIIGKMKRSSVLWRGIAVFSLALLFVGIPAFYKSQVILSQISLLQEYQAPGLKRWGESFVSTFLYQVHPLISIAAVFSCIEALRRKDLKFLIISWLLILIVVMQIKRSRYVLIAFPMLALMASYGLQRIRVLEVKKYIAACIVFSSLIIASQAYHPLLSNMALANLKTTGEFLNKIRPGKVAVRTIPSDDPVLDIAVTVPILDLYTHDEIIFDGDSGIDPPFADIEESSLRFTWDYAAPRYYQEGFRGKVPGALVVITGLPVGFTGKIIEGSVGSGNLKEVFEVSTGLFQFSPGVLIYYRGD